MYRYNGGGILGDPRAWGGGGQWGRGWGQGGRWGGGGGEPPGAYYRPDDGGGRTNWMPPFDGGGRDSGRWGGPSEFQSLGPDLGVGGRGIWGPDGRDGMAGASAGNPGGVSMGMQDPRGVPNPMGPEWSRPGIGEPGGMRPGGPTGPLRPGQPLGGGGGFGGFGGGVRRGMPPMGGRTNWMPRFGGNQR